MPIATELPVVEQTSLPVIAQVSRVVTRIVDRITGDRSDYPLMVAAACVEALKCHGIQSRVMYGQAAWTEVMEDHSVVWSGCWGENIYFWVATQFGEVVDLNASVASRKQAHSRPYTKSLYSPPMLWSAEVPAFYRYCPEGVAELELTDEKDQRRFELVLAEVRDEVKRSKADEELEFPNEPILCPGRKLLDDSRQTFQYFDRALCVHGIPQAPL